jgi:heat-inducible transcriptional repressor
VDTRTADILEAAVREYIGTGLPVSSGLLYEHYDFGIKPAMIRLELNDLEEAGYLEQPHHAAGRVPRDKAYEFYADRALEREASRAPNKTLTELGEAHEWSQLAEYISRELNALSVLADTFSGAIYKEGLERLVNHLELHDRTELTNVIRDFEAIDERLDGLQSAKPEVQVFVGKRSPLTRSEQLTTFAAHYTVPRGHITIVTVGPKRMDYAKGAHLLQSLYEILN